MQASQAVQNPVRTDTWKLWEYDPKQIVSRFRAVGCPCNYVDSKYDGYSVFSRHIMDKMITPEKYEAYDAIIAQIEKEGYRGKKVVSKGVAHRRKVLECQVCGKEIGSLTLRCAAVKTGKTKTRGKRYIKTSPVFKDVGKKMCPGCWEGRL